MPRDLDPQDSPSDPSIEPSRDLSIDPSSDPWSRLRSATPARIGLGRAGDALALTHVLDLQHGHAKARDAVHVPLDVDKLEQTLAGRETRRVWSQVSDRSVYLRRPDLGCRLDPACETALTGEAFDAVFVIADGLSSAAVERHAVAVLDATLAHLKGWSIAPIVIATQARVALADEIGERLGATLGVILIGERPGLSAADSLGAYLTFGPRRGRRDSERNCISNIHGAGLRPDQAAAKLAWLMNEARRRGLSGIGLKDEMPAALSGDAAPSLDLDQDASRAGVFLRADQEGRDAS